MEVISVDTGPWDEAGVWTPRVPTLAGEDNATVDNGHVVTADSGGDDCIGLTIDAGGEVDVSDGLYMGGNVDVAGDLDGVATVYVGGSLIVTGAGTIGALGYLHFTGDSGGDQVVDLHGSTVGDVLIDSGGEDSRALGGDFRCADLAVYSYCDLDEYDIYCVDWGEYNGARIAGDGDIFCSGNIYHFDGDGPHHVNHAGRLVGSGASHTIAINTALMGGINLTLTTGSDYTMTNHVRVRSLHMEGTASMHGAKSLVMYPIEDDWWDVAAATAGLDVTGLSIGMAFLYLDQTGANPAVPRGERLPNITNSAEMKVPADISATQCVLQSWDKTSFGTFAGGMNLTTALDLFVLAYSIVGDPVGGAAIEAHLVCKDVKLGRGDGGNPNCSGWLKLVDAVVVCTTIYAVDQTAAIDLQNEVEAENTLFNAGPFNGVGLALTFSKGCRIAGELVDCAFGAGVYVQAWGAIDGGGNTGAIEWQPRQVGGIMPLAVV